MAKNKIKSTKKKSFLNWNFIIFGIIALIIVVFGLTIFRAEFFDIFGIMVFSFLLILGGWMLLTDVETPDWAAWIVLIIGALGIVTDGWIVIKTFIIGG
jgi:hypothetical protein